MKTYSFTLVVKQYSRKNCVLDDMRVICNGRTTLVAKNHKFGGLYLHKCAKIIKGHFHKRGGSNSYPILMAHNEVHIRITDLHSKANIITDQHIKQDIINVIDCSY